MAVNKAFWNVNTENLNSQACVQTGLELPGDLKGSAGWNGLAVLKPWGLRGRECVLLTEGEGGRECGQRGSRRANRKSMAWEAA